MEDLTVPPFGKWEYANELSYTHHYFSCATQATGAGYNCYSTGDLYAVESWRNGSTPSKKAVKEHTRQNARTVYNVESLKQPRMKKLNRARREAATSQYAKPVDEDLYKIPPDLIRAYKRKKMVGFFSRLVPTCLR